MKQEKEPITNKKLRVFMIGLRGFPNVQGGVEIHAEHLCPLLFREGIEIDVAIRTPYVSRTHPEKWNGVHFVRIWTVKLKIMETILHSFLAVLYAAILRPDIIHIQAIGSGLLAPLARLLGLKVIMTHHGPDYDRQKWGGFARTMLRLGERLGVRWSHGTIVISKVISDIVKTKYKRSSFLILNGVEFPEIETSTKTLDRFGLKPGKYILMVTRFVEEKRHLDLIEGFTRANMKNYKLVLVGRADHPGPYVKKIRERLAKEERIIMTGFQTGKSLKELYSHAGLFVLPSSHEGMPIALLEALSYGLPVLASDIKPNLEIGLKSEHYFPLGNIDVLSERLISLSGRKQGRAKREEIRKWVSDRYDWNTVTKQTIEAYRTILENGKK
jgi:glycosyltransferase involved in cell wall biosynthesis